MRDQRALRRRDRCAVIAASDAAGSAVLEAADLAVEQISRLPPAPDGPVALRDVGSPYRPQLDDA
jgi:hypothetical protein